jgi:putative glycosyltransferase (TIGR04348 family)
MPAPTAVIVTPAPPASRSGNRNTAVRWARILRRLGWRVRVATQWQGERCDLFVALHARRSHASLAAFRRARPQTPAVLALTGTDLYRDIRHSPQAQESLALADRYIGLQALAPLELAPALRPRLHVIHQSEVAHYAWRPPRRLFRVCVLGHLREEKDPFRAALALQRLPPQPRIELVQAGAAMSPDMAQEARRLMAAEPRYRWLGELPHWRALRLMAASHVMLISSRMEGGAHVVSEAIAQGVPVLASRIAGNLGLLGEDYAGCYPVADEAALATLIARAAAEPEFLARLRAQVLARQPLIEPRREVEAWQALLRALGLPAGAAAGPSPR